MSFPFAASATSYSPLRAKSLSALNSLEFDGVILWTEKELLTFVSNLPSLYQRMHVHDVLLTTDTKIQQALEVLGESRRRMIAGSCSGVIPIRTAQVPLSVVFRMEFVLKKIELLVEYMMVQNEKLMDHAGGNEGSWQRRYQELIEFKRKHDNSVPTNSAGSLGSCTVKNQTCNNEAPLCQSYSLTPGQIEMPNQLGFQRNTKGNGTADISVPAKESDGHGKRNRKNGKMMPQSSLSSEVAVHAASLDGPTRIKNGNGIANVTKDKLAQHQPNCFLDDEKARRAVALAALALYDDQTNPKPKRPLSAYNLFFRFERARILSAQAEMMRVRKERATNNSDDDDDDDDDDNDDDDTSTGSAAIDASLDEVLSSLSPIDANVNDPDDPIQRAQLYAEITDKLTNNPFHTDRSNRKHRKSHGMISFSQLIRLMSSRWREVCGDSEAPSKNKSPLVKSLFEELANEGRTVYKAKMKKWREARAALENTVDPKGLVQANERLANGASQGSANKKRKADSAKGNAHDAAAAPTDVFSNIEAFVQNPSTSIHQKPKRRRKESETLCESPPVESVGADADRMIASSSDINEQTDQKYSRAKWHRRYQELVEYKNKHGHCNVSVKSGPLGWWVSKVRARYNEVPSERNYPLTPGQIDQLNQLGFRWKIVTASRDPYGRFI